MYLKIGGYTRPFLEANVDPSYKNYFDGRRNLYKVGVNYEIDGKIVLQTNASEAQMTREIAALKQALYQSNPDIVFLQSDRSTPSAFALYARDTLNGIQITDISLPSNAGRLYHTSCPYRFTVQAEVLTSSTANPILEFTETLEDAGTGGWEKVFIGGAINPVEEQIGNQYSSFRYVQSGSALGLLGYPAIPGPVWPFALKRPRPRISRQSPELIAGQYQNFRINWAWEFESSIELFGEPHIFTV